MSCLEKKTVGQCVWIIYNEHTLNTNLRLVEFKLHDRGSQSIIYRMLLVLALYAVCICSSILSHRPSR